MQWLKLPAWKVGDRGLEPHSGLQVSKKQYVSSRSLVMIQYFGEPLLPRGGMLGIARARISNPVSGGQCHLTILRRFSRPS